MLTLQVCGVKNLALKPHFLSGVLSYIRSSGVLQSQYATRDLLSYHSVLLCLSIVLWHVCQCMRAQGRREALTPIGWFVSATTSSIPCSCLRINCKAISVHTSTNNATNDKQILFVYLHSKCARRYKLGYSILGCKYI